MFIPGAVRANHDSGGYIGAHDVHPVVSNLSLFAQCIQLNVNLTIKHLQKENETMHKFDNQFVGNHFNTALLNIPYYACKQLLAISFYVSAQLMQC